MLSPEGRIDMVRDLIEVDRRSKAGACTHIVTQMEMTRLSKFLHVRPSLSENIAA